MFDMSPLPLTVLRVPSELRAQVRAWRARGDRVALVPTMGALHAGHLSLVDEAKSRAAQVVVSIFVNPTQFAPHEDFDRYPRTEDRDAAMLAEHGKASAIYAPPAREMYGDGFATTVSLGGPALGLESDARPHFFAGVATVVSKLLLQCLPDAALFGEKDFQQLAVIRQMVRDLDIPVDILGCPTMREADGLAMSSRNAYLSAGARAIAGRLNVAMRDLADAVRAGGDSLAGAAKGRAQLLAAGFDAVDYLEVRDALTLSSALRPGAAWRVLAAARLGGVRLIDNCAV
jgi:pantoate--beta-alanine ligase